MRIKWDETGKRFYETGINQGVLYLLAEGAYGKGVAWNGLTSVSEKPTGAEASPLYADNIKYLNLISAEDFEASIEAYTYPDEFAGCDGYKEIAPGVMATQQNRAMFGMSYKTILGNDTENESYGYKLHLIYGAVASPAERNYSTVNDSPEAMTLSWELKTTPVSVPGMKPTARIIIDSTKCDAGKLKALEDILYGTEEKEPRLPLPDEVATLMKQV